jgi:outer membrane protein assembly factor BamB/predicted phosphodiesterase
MRYFGRLIFMLAVLFICSFNSVNGQQLSFAFLTDLHVSPGSDNEAALNKAVDDINKQNFDFVVVTGDLTNTGSNAELMSVKTALDKLNKPLLIIPGNHETNWSESAGLYFNQLWGNDRFIFRKNGYLLVGFNTGPFMKMGDGHVKQEDIQWLKRVLSEKQNEKLIAFSHYPIADGLDNWTDIAGVLKANNCLIDFCGHGHRLMLMNFDGMPGVMGRALKDKKGFGYNKVELTGEKAIVTEQLFSEEFNPESISVDLLSPGNLSGIAVSPKPDFAINNNSSAQIDFNLEDTVSIFSGPCLVGDSLIIYGNSVGWLKAFRIKDNTKLWERQFKGSIYSTPVLASNNIIFGTADGFIKGLDLKTGKEKWSVNTESPVLAEAIVENNHIYIGGGSKAFYKIDATTGNIVWKFTGLTGLVQGKPAISGNNIIFGAWDTHLYCLSKETGNLQWKWDNGKKQTLLSPGNIVPAISNNKVFIVAPERFFTALDLKTGKEIWRTGKYRVRESMGISPDGKYVFAKLMNDSVIAVPATSKDFKLQWAANAGIGYDHNPCPIASNKKFMAIATKNGLLVVLDKKTGNILWKHKIGNSSINKLVFQKNGKLWLTSTEGKIISLSYKL